jgi:predicted nucleic acid-binding protein
MRLFLDANIIFSGAYSPNGRAKALFLLARHRRCEMLSSPHAIEEARRNIQLKYPEKFDDLASLISELVVTAEATAASVAWALEQSLPLEDAPILAAAIDARADLLVTGDRTHFGRLYGRSMQGTIVVTPSDALAQITALGPNQE